MTVGRNPQVFRSWPVTASRSSSGGVIIVSRTAEKNIHVGGLDKIFSYDRLSRCVSSVVSPRESLCILTILMNLEVQVDVLVKVSFAIEYCIYAPTVYRNYRSQNPILNRRADHKCARRIKCKQPVYIPEAGTTAKRLSLIGFIRSTRIHQVYDEFIYSKNSKFSRIFQ